MCYKSEFQILRKNGLKMEEFLRKVKELSDNLLLAGCPLSSEDLITQTLSGLDVKYNAIIVQLSEQHGLTWIELQASLLTFESRLEQLSSMSQNIQSSENIVVGKPKNNSRQGGRGQGTYGSGRTGHEEVDVLIIVPRVKFVPR